MNPRHRLMADRYGYARHACDGALSWPRVEVWNAAELMDAVQTDHRWIAIRGGWYDGHEWHRSVYDLPHMLEPAPHVVLQGFGRPTITGHGIRCRHPHLLAGGLTIRDVVGDALEVTSGGREACFSRMLIEGWGDGALDLVRAPEGGRDDALNVSLVRSTIRYGNKCILIGSKDGRQHDRRYRFTVHRSTFHDVGLRAPWRMRYAVAHASYVRVDGVSGSTACHMDNGARGTMEHVEFRNLAREAVTVDDDGTALRTRRVIGAPVPSVRPELVTWPDYTKGEDGR